MKSSSRELTFMFAVVVVVGWLTVNLVSLSRAYPHYFQWDMDLTTTVDGLMLGSGRLPAHINHTGFGMYLVQAATGSVARSFDVVSVASLEDVSASLNPLSGVAEFTTFLRLHSPFIGVAMVLLLWGGISLIFRPSRLTSFMALTVLCTMVTLLHHATLIRTEFYAVLFWAGAFFLLALAVRATRPAATLLWLFGSGVLLGLCFLTKIQALLYVAGFPILLLIALNHGSDSALRPQARGSERARGIASLCASGINAMAIPTLLVSASRVKMPYGMGVFEYHGDAAELEIAPYAMLLVAALATLFALQLVLLWRSRMESALFRLLGLLSWLAFGFTASFLLHFLVLPQPDLALYYLLLDAKMLFFRGTYYDLRSFSEYLSDALAIVRYTAWALGCHLVLLTLLVVGKLRGWLSLSGPQLLALMAGSGILFLQIFVATRPISRDMIFVEPIADLLTLVFVLVIAKRAVRHRTGLYAISLAVATVLIGSNLLHAGRTPRDLHFMGSQYGWHPYRWFSLVYPWQAPYKRLMLEHYQEDTRAVAAPLARRQAEIRRVVEFVFQNQTITHRNIGPLALGFPVWTSDLDWRISALPEDFEGIVVDNGSLPTRPDSTWDFRAQTDLGSEKQVPPGHIVALDRTDLEVYLFVERRDVFRLRRRRLVFEPSLKIRLKNGKESRTMRALRVALLAEIPVDRIKGSFFFVIRQL